jgi:hypothetical protein
MEQAGLFQDPNKTALMDGVQTKVRDESYLQSVVSLSGIQAPYYY